MQNVKKIHLGSRKLKMIRFIIKLYISHWL